MTRRTVLRFIAALLCCTAAAAQENVLTIATWNIQTFGQTKAESNRLYPIAALLAAFDVTVVQEIRSKDWYGLIAQTAVQVMNAESGESGRRWKFAVSEPLGRSSSRENYLYIYDSSRVELFNSAGDCIGIDPESFTDIDGDGFIGKDEIRFHAETFPDTGDWFEREPAAVLMRCVDGGFDAVLVNTHVKPADAEAEIFLLDDAARYFSALFGERDVLIAGDFNADGSYFDEAELAEAFCALEFFCIVPDSQDTTVAASSRTYDRIVCTVSMQEDCAGSAEVFSIAPYIRAAQAAYGYDDVFTEKNISDHYPVCSYWYTDRDTD